MRHQNTEGSARIHSCFKLFEYVMRWARRSPVQRGSPEPLDGGSETHQPSGKPPGPDGGFSAARVGELEIW